MTEGASIIVRKCYIVPKWHVQIVQVASLHFSFLFYICSALNGEYNYFVDYNRSNWFPLLQMVARPDRTNSSNKII